MSILTDYLSVISGLCIKIEGSCFNIICQKSRKSWNWTLKWKKRRNWPQTAKMTIENGLHIRYLKKVKGLKDTVFESVSVKHAVQFTQITLNSDVARMIRDVECPVFKFPKQPLAQIITDPNGKLIQERFNEMEMYIWKKDYELVHKQRAEFEEKEKRVLLIVLGQCSPSLRSKFKGAMSLQDTCEKNDVI